ncbi:MAG: CTP synthase, partial [Clostridiales bacterium]|nr:CTP synthase [Clostridiales bacterium]
YVDSHNAYVSLVETLDHSGVDLDTGVEIVWISSEKINATSTSRLQNLDGIVIPAGFGERGFEGKVNTAKYAREKGVPVLMIGMGAQAGLVEYSRNVCGMEKANSTEFDRKPQYPVVYSLYEAPRFRCGAYTTLLKTGSRLKEIYGKDEISERHRHKYEFNPALAKQIEKAGLVFSGKAQSGKVYEAYELPTHPFYIGVMFRPEFKSRPLCPHPLITAFIKACKTYADQKRESDKQ